MRRVEAILAVVLTASLSGCVVRSKQAVVPPAPAPPQPAPPPAPQQLSIPQTRVQLPPAQPLNPEALATVPPPDATPAPIAIKPPARPPVRTQPRPEPPAPPAEPSRPPVQEVLSPEVQQQLRSSAQSRKSQIRTIVGQVSRRRLTDDQNNLLKTINQFVKLSDDAERSGDLRSAEELAQRAYILARELQSGK